MTGLTLKDPILHRIFLFGLFVLGGLMLFANLGNHYLWQDEAETALVAKTILESGIPKATDGLNNFAPIGERTYDENFTWTLDPWMPFYLTALSFKLFGVSTLTARLPFAFFSFLTLILIYISTEKLFKSKKLSYLSIIFAITSIAFLLLSRQCRYYSLTMFFSLLGFYAYLMLEKDKKYFFYLLISCISLGLCQYLYTISLLVTLFGHTYICGKKHLKQLVIIAGLFVLTTFPVLSQLIGTEGYVSSYKVLESISHDGRLFEYMGIRLYQFAFELFNPFILCIPILLYVLKKKDAIQNVFNQPYVKLFLIYVVVTIIFTTIPTPGPYFRYLSGLIPIACVISAMLFSHVLLLKWPFLVLTIALCLTVSSLPDYFYELTHDYDGPVEGVVNYLNENAKEDDIVVISYATSPVMFYTSLRVLNLKIPEDAALFNKANWLIPQDNYYGRKVREMILKQVKKGRFKKIELPYPDIPFENREDPIYHSFKTVEEGPRLTIYKKR